MKKWLVWVIAIIILVALLFAGLYLTRKTFRSATDKINVNNEGDCSSDIYDCSDFANQEIAQITYSRCMNEVGYDVHNLDKDDDGKACESL
jgi:sugar phosphate permease